jgi:transposase
VFFVNETTMNPSINDEPLDQYAAFIAIDWADQVHAYSLQAAGDKKKESGTLEQKPEIIGPWVAKLQERFKGQPVAIAVEQSRGALIHALLCYDFITIYPIHPATVANFRQAFKFSGAKSDPLDTDQILEILTKHLQLLRPLRPESEQTRLLTRLVEGRRNTVDWRTTHIQAALASLKEYFPQAIELCSSNLSSRLAYNLLKKWPSFEALQQAKPSTIKRFFYAHNIRSPELIQRAVDLAATGRALTSDAAILESSSRMCLMHLKVIQSLNPIIEDYDKRIEEVFNSHSEAYLFDKLPGAGPALAPRLLTSFGTDRSRYDAASNVQTFSGIAPVTKSSGRTKVVYCRQACPKFIRQTFHEFARLSIYRSQWARNYLDYYKAKGKKFHTIIRALAFKWIRVLFHCWKNRTPYNETTYMESLKKRGSIFATLHLQQKP